MSNNQNLREQAKNPMGSFRRISANTVVAHVPGHKPAMMSPEQVEQILGKGAFQRIPATGSEVRFPIKPEAALDILERAAGHQVLNQLREGGRIVLGNFGN